MQLPSKQKNLDKASTSRAHETSEQRRARLERENTRFLSLAAINEPQNSSERELQDRFDSIESKMKMALKTAGKETTDMIILEYRKQFNEKLYKSDVEQVRNFIEDLKRFVIPLYEKLKDENPPSQRDAKVSSHYSESTDGIMREPSPTPEQAREFLSDYTSR